MKKRSHLQVMARLIGLVKPMAGYMTLAILMGVLGFLCSTLITILGCYGILRALGMGVRPLKTILAATLLLGLLRGFLRYGEQLCNHYVAFKLLALIRDKVFAALRRLSPAKLESKEKGNLIAVITADIELLEVFFAHTISPVAIAAIMSTLMALFIGRFHWSMGVLAAVGYGAVGIVVPSYISRKSGDTGRRFRESSGSLSSYMLDNIFGLRETAQYAAGEKRLNELVNRTDALALIEERVRRITGNNVAITNAAILFCGLSMALLSAALFTRRLIGLDGVLIGVVAMLGSFGPVVALANLGSSLQNTFAAGNRVIDVLDEDPVVDEVHGEENIAFRGASCDRVTFSYGCGTVLDEVTLDIPQNSVIGIVGRSGSGKSTLLKLLMRFWDVDSGSVRLSGRDVRKVNTENLRDMQSFVTQDTHLFNDTIAGNLRIAKMSASREEMERACRKAAVHEFIFSLPHGYDTNVGDMGGNLSGGERQRIGLVRAFLHDAPFILLDEPTSNLDSLNEAAILKSIHDERRDKTVVLVSHRASTMRIVDRLYSVERGRMS